MTYVECIPASWTVGWLNPKLAKLTFVSDRLVAFEASILVIEHVGQVLLRPRAEGLVAFGRVNGCNSNLVLRLGGVEDGDGVAVVDAYDAASEGSGVQIGNKNRKNNEGKKPHVYMLT